MAQGTRGALSSAGGSALQEAETHWGRLLPVPGGCSMLLLEKQSPSAWGMVSSQVVFLFMSSFLLLFSTESWLTVRLSAVSCSAVRLTAVWLWWGPAESLHCLLGRSKNSPLLSCLALRLCGHLQSHFFLPSLSFPCRSLHSF